MATQSHHIFIFSTTLDSRLAIGDAANRACLQIFEPATFLQHVRRAVERHRKARTDTLIHDRVCYWSPENPPREVWALPHRLTLSKYEGYARDQEYRFSFGTRRDVFDFENVTGLVVPEGYKYPQLALEPQAHRLKLFLGPLEDCCRLLASAGDSGRCNTADRAGQFSNGLDCTLLPGLGSNDTDALLSGPVVALPQIRRSRSTCIAIANYYPLVRLKDAFNHGRWGTRRQCNDSLARCVQRRTVQEPDRRRPTG